jgi:guanine deaminase
MRQAFRGQAPRFRRGLSTQKGAKKPVKIFEGTLVHSLGLKQLEIIPNGRIGIDEDGQILFVARTPVEKQDSVDIFGYSPSVAITDLGNKILMPGFIDTHTHAPQYSFTGTGTGLPLLQWLEKYTFNYESKFADRDFADQIYNTAVKRHLSHGSTTVVYFGTIHTGATLQLAHITERLGQR